MTMQSVIVNKLVFGFLLLACNAFSTSSCETVSLIPMGNVTFCPKDIATFACRTTNGAMIWELVTISGGTIQELINDETQAGSQSNLGIYRLSVLHVSTESGTVVQVVSTATTLFGLRLEDDGTVLSCLVGSNFTREKAILRVAGAPQAPVVTFRILTQNIVFSSLLISWSVSDCAVQYVVTINSSDADMVYNNITTSDTNTTVMLPNGVEYCVTVVAVDGIGRRGQDSVPLCDYTPPTVSMPVSVTSSGSGSPRPTPTAPVEHQMNLTAVIALAVVVLILFMVIVAMAVMIHVLRRKSTYHADNPVGGPDNNLPMNIINEDRLEPRIIECVCQVFFQQIPGLLNNWKFIFTIFPKEHLSAVDQFNNMQIYDGSHDVQLQISPDMIDDVLINIISHVSNGWKRQQESSLALSRTKIEQYNGEGVPPHCEMIFKAAEINLPDLSFTASFNELQNPLEILIDDHFVAQNIVECIAQVFYQKLGLNNWKFIFTIFSKEHLNAMLDQFNDMKMYGGNVHLNMTDNVSIKISDTSDGWNWHQNEFSISRTKVEQYKGTGEPPHCEMIVKAAAEDVTPSDLSFTASFNGLQNSLTIEDSHCFEVQNVVECSAQVFYYNVKVNWWKAIIAFFPTEQQKQVEQIYQDANIGPHQPLNFSGGKISIEAREIAGWNVLKSDELHEEVNTAEIEQYNGEGKPPYCELTLHAVSDDETPPDLKLLVTLIGIKKLNIITLKRTCQSVDVAKSTAAGSTYACQVFYHKIDTNHWRATFAFFPKEKIDKVKDKFYQDANLGPTITVEFSAGTFIPGPAQSAIKSAPIDDKANREIGWQVQSTQGKKIYRSEIVQYTGEHEPPHFEIILKPVSDETVPSDPFKQVIIIYGVNPPNTIVLERALDTTDP